MARYLNNQKYQRRYLGNTKLKKKYLGEINVWSGGSVVSYYNGTTLLGTREVDEGADVLHDTGFTPTKTNYTFIGWASEPNGTRFETLVATGEPMSLYALWLPNTLTVLSATLLTAVGSVNPEYTLVSHDSKYIPEVKYAESSSWYNASYSNSDTKTMRVMIGLYQLMTVQGKALKNHNEGGGSINGVTSSGNTVTLTFNSDTDIVMYCWNRHEVPETWSMTITGCTNITLSNPTQWV